jgi:hypothetical protein
VRSCRWFYHRRRCGSGQNPNSTVDHVTARRLAIWLAARPQSPEFARALVRFIQTGAITQPLKAHLRIHSRSAGTYPDHAQATVFLQYCTARGADHGPIGPDCGSACDRIDHADVMLAEARRDAKTRTVSLILGTTTANIAMYAITAYAGDREAHVREVEQVGEAFPKDGRASDMAPSKTLSNCWPWGRQDRRTLGRANRGVGGLHDGGVGRVEVG